MELADNVAIQGTHGGSAKTLDGSGHDPHHCGIPLAVTRTVVAEECHGCSSGSDVFLKVPRRWVGGLLI
jgi:hypothetical protein